MSHRFISEDKVEGIEKALGKTGLWEILSLDHSLLRLFRAGDNPPSGGTYIKTSDNRYHLYTKGYVPFMREYWGPATLKPLTITQHIGDSPIEKTHSETLVLTKMNWNSASFSLREPITLHFSLKVGGFLSEAETKVESKTRYFMPYVTQHGTFGLQKKE